MLKEAGLTVLGAQKAADGGHGLLVGDGLGILGSGHARGAVRLRFPGQERRDLDRRGQ